MENLNLYYWNFYKGRGGKIEGLFLATEEQMLEAYDSSIYMGEVMGKHSEMYGRFEECDVTLRSSDQNLIQLLVSQVTMIDENTLCGYNPLHYVEKSCASCGDSDLPENMAGEMCWICNELYEKELHEG